MPATTDLAANLLAALRLALVDYVPPAIVVVYDVESDEDEDPRPCDPRDEYHHPDD